MTFKSFLLVLLSCIALGGLLVPQPALAEKAKKLTPMELQAIQSREFEVPKEVAFGAVMTVIQDLGYTVQSADIVSGFITAASPVENKTNFLEAFGGASSSGNTVITIFLMQMPNRMTRIRLNFVNSKNVSSAYGRDSRQDKPILDPAVYSNAWERIDEALFVMGALTDASKEVVAPAASDKSNASPASDGIGSPVSELQDGPNATVGEDLEQAVEATIPNGASF